jgi:predicted short-subunit dehydrogenase-like oxidoreductase (DUF2520 family)
MGTVPLSVVLIGKGQVGQALARALRRSGATTRAFALRGGLPRNIGQPDLILICVRDHQIQTVATWLSCHGLTKRTVVAHVSGAMSADALQALRPNCRAVAQCHPFRSICAAVATSFEGAHFLVSGDRASLGTLRRLTRLLGSVLVDGQNVDPVKYHLGAALLANGGVALLQVARLLLVESGIESTTAVGMLVDLQQSVLNNVRRSGIEAALTGPVRRGDIETLRKHLTVLARKGQSLEIYAALARAQIGIVQGLGELEPAVIVRLNRMLASK